MFVKKLNRISHSFQYFWVSQTILTAFHENSSFVFKKEYGHNFFLISRLLDLDPGFIFDYSSARVISFVPLNVEHIEHGLINFIDTKANCRHKKILTYTRTLRQFYQSL